MLVFVCFALYIGVAMRKDDTTPQFLTVRQAAEAFQVTPETVRLWIRKGTIDSIRVGRRGNLRIPVESINLTKQEIRS